MSRKRNFRSFKEFECYHGCRIDEVSQNILRAALYFHYPDWLRNIRSVSDLPGYDAYIDNTYSIIIPRSISHLNDDLKVMNLILQNELKWRLFDYGTESIFYFDNAEDFTLVKLSI